MKVASRANYRRSVTDAAKLLGCEMQTKSGKPCTSPPIRGTSRCYMHSGDNARRAGHRGGLRRTVYNLDELAPCDVPKSAQDVLHILARTICDVRMGAIDPRTAGVLCIVCSAYLDAYELVELERQVAALQAASLPRFPELSP